MYLIYSNGPKPEPCDMLCADFYKLEITLWYQYKIA